MVQQRCKTKPLRRSGVSRFLFATALFLAPLALTIPSAPSRAEDALDKIITWGGNAPDWNKKLHVSAIRIGCSDPPQSCVGTVNQESSQQHVKSVFLAIALKNPQTVSYAATYSMLSKANPRLVEVGFDDFVGQADRLGMDPPTLNNFISQIATALKLGNPNLKFGLTIYENELATQLPRIGINGSDAAKQVDYVHLYPHYRRDSTPFSKYVEQAKSIFPNAQIIAGVYAYDRRDYVPCSRGSSEHCSNEEELSLFKDMFQQELNLLRSGQVSWLEFYPGSFGIEDSWKSWDAPRICAAARRQECIDNTRVMRQQVLQILSGH